MPVPDWLAQFGQRCAALPGASTVTAGNGLTVTLRGRAIQVDADRDDPGRAGLWTELDRPARRDDAALAALALARTTDDLVPTGLATGYNPKVRLLLRGRSVEREAMAPGSEAALLDSVLDAEPTNAAPPAPGRPDPRFAAYVAEALAAAGIDIPELDGNRLLLKVAERWIEVLFVPGGDVVRGQAGRLVFVGLVAVGQPVKADLVGQFNAYNLFHGGYALISPPDTGAVYLAQGHAMALLPAAEMLGRLATFADRALSAGAWYETWKEPAAAA